MDGGVSHVDSFDPKERLQKESGKPLPLERPQHVRAVSPTLFGSPFEFQRYGQCGAAGEQPVPARRHLRRRHGDHPLDGGRTFRAHRRQLLHAQRVRSAGAAEHGRLGDLRPGQPVPESSRICGDGHRHDSARRRGHFRQRLPACQLPGLAVPAGPFPGRRHRAARERQRACRKASSTCCIGSTAAWRSATARSTRWTRRSPTTSWRSACSRRSRNWWTLSGETEATTKLYGLDEKDTEDFGRACLLARRMVERGVRFIELLPPKREGADRWDQHARLKEGHTANAKATDKPIAALLKDLKARGLLDQTLVIWGGEFGRTPTAQGTGDSPGRDHHPYGFTMWLAGGGIKGGVIHGATDEYGYYAVENKVTVHDLHATALHLLGLDHTRLTFPFGGREMRLTDVHGEVVKEILA